MVRDIGVTDRIRQDESTNPFSVSLVRGYNYLWIVRMVSPPEKDSQGISSVLIGIHGVTYQGLRYQRKDVPTKSLDDLGSTAWRVSVRIRRGGDTKKKRTDLLDEAANQLSLAVGTGASRSTSTRREGEQ